MAEDVIALIDYVGWSESQRDLHVVGVSLGGMVALGTFPLHPYFSTLTCKQSWPL